MLYVKAIHFTSQKANVLSSLDITSQGILAPQCCALADLAQSFKGKTEIITRGQSLSLKYTGSNANFLCISGHDLSNQQILMWVYKNVQYNKSGESQFQQGNNFKDYGQLATPILTYFQKSIDLKEGGYLGPINRFKHLNHFLSNLNSYQVRIAQLKDAINSEDQEQVRAACSEKVAILRYYSKDSYLALWFLIVLILNI